MKMRGLAVPVGAALAALVVAACGGSSSGNGGGNGGHNTGGGGGGQGAGGGSVTINGSGSTFAAPIYQQWGSTLKNQGLIVNYAPTGSGTGVAQLQSGTVDFAGSDPSMTNSQITAAKGPVFHFPVAFGAITISYHLPGVESGLHLDGATIADIFLGKIKNWNDPAIAKLNPGKHLPNQAITVVHRSDSSGTTAEFTEFLDDYSPAWKSQVGSGKEVKFPVGTGGKGNSGVAAAVKQTVGAIGYVEAAYALQNGFTFASVKNRAGHWVAPTLESTSAVTAGLHVPHDLRISVINATGAPAYPIAGQTFLIAYQDMCKAGMSRSKADGVKKFLTYAMGPGQDVLSKLFYARLPADVDAKAKAQISELKCNGHSL